MLSVAMQFIKTLKILHRLFGPRKIQQVKECHKLKFGLLPSEQEAREFQICRPYD